MKKRYRFQVVLIAYVEDGRKGGALTTLQYAKKKNVEIIHFADNP